MHTSKPIIMHFEPSRPSFESIDTNGRLGQAGVGTDHEAQSSFDASPNSSCRIGISRKTRRLCTALSDNASDQSATGFERVLKDDCLVSSLRALTHFAGWF